jgi:Transglutaminase-like superfamily
MSVPLAPHIHLAVLGDDIVLLDVLGDAYVCLPGGLDQLRPSLDRAAISPADEEVLAELAGAGFVGGTADRYRSHPPPLPRDDLGSHESNSLRAGDVLRLVASVWDLAWRYRGQSFGEILAFVAAAPKGRPESADDIIRLARLFQRYAIWLPIPRKCLVRSFVLLRFLQRSGLNAQWVFGVRTWPFGAHCWLQLGAVALDDFPERLAAYQPILSVG